MNQRAKVLDRARKVGYVDNKWAIQNGIWRLGNVIFVLTHMGFKFPKREFLKDKKGRITKNYAYFIK